jgi:hypothetical protein
MLISFGSVEAATSEANHCHGHDLRIGVAFIDVVIVGIGAVIIDVIVVVIVIHIGCHNRGDVEGTTKREKHFRYRYILYSKIAIGEHR